MNRIRNIILVFLTLGILGACTKDFKELNTDPNSSEKALPEYLMARALVETVSNNMTRSRGLTNELMQVTVNTLVETDRIFRYDIANSVSEAPWNNWYLQLTNFKDMYSSADEGYVKEPKKANSFKGISLILQTWVYAMLTDTYGDIPYFNSNSAGVNAVFTPEFDRQKDIYMDFYAKLDSANVLLANAVNIPATSDPIYKGNIANWRKFGNSLYLRLLLRASQKEETQAFVLDKIQKIAETEKANYPIIASNEESAILRWTGVAPYASPFVKLTDAQWKQQKAGKVFVDSLLFKEDPCVDAWLVKSNGEYEGIESGYMIGHTPEGRSTMNPALKSSPLMGNILNYAEVQLMLAEIALRELVTTSPAAVKGYYDNGVAARITWWGKTADAANTYLFNQRVAWNESQPYEVKLEKIMYQKYLAMIFTDIQNWAEYRRTGFPVMPKGNGLMNEKIMPTRLYYPSSVQAANPQNYKDAVAKQGPDLLKTLIWWENHTY